MFLSDFTKLTFIMINSVIIGLLIINKIFKKREIPIFLFPGDKRDNFKHVTKAMQKRKGSSYD